MAINRGLQRVWATCLETDDPSCSYSNPTIQNFSWYYGGPWRLGAEWDRYPVSNQ